MNASGHDTAPYLSGVEIRYPESRPMTLRDAPLYDPAKARRRKVRITVILVVAIALAALGWFFRNWPEEHSVNKFFDALQQQNYETAYGIYFHDPGWRQHQQQYSKYTYADFYRDWGPGGEWGLIKSHSIYGTADTKKFGGGGVVVEVVINERSEHARMFVQKSDKTITVYPF
jgi:hypothetical protein